MRKWWCEFLLFTRPSFSNFRGTGSETISEYREVTVPLQDYIDSLEVKACSDLMTVSQSTGKWLYHYKITSWIHTLWRSGNQTTYQRKYVYTIASLSPRSPVHKLSIWFADCLQWGKPEAIDTLHEPYLHFCYEVALETSAKCSSIKSPRVHDIF